MDKEGLKLEIELLEGNSPCPGKQESGPNMPELLLIIPDKELKMRLNSQINAAYPGCCIRHVNDALEAYALLSHQAPDIVISELSMPYLSGYGLMKKLRSQTAFNQIPIILLSAEPIETIAETQYSWWCDPFNGDELKEVLMEVLDK